MRTKTFFEQMLIFVLANILTFLFDLELQAQPSQSKLIRAAELNNSNITDTNHIARSRFNYVIIDAPHNTYGYDIYDDNHKLIHQPSIPGLPGNDGFKTKADALKVAQLVCDKLKKGEMPPSISVEEMKQLNIEIK